jgi:hypothetical protein
MRKYYTLEMIVKMNNQPISRAPEGRNLFIFENPFEMDSKISIQQKIHHKITVIKHSNTR